MCKIIDFGVHFHVISGKIHGFRGLVFRLVLFGFFLVFPGCVHGISSGIDSIWFGIFLGCVARRLVFLRYEIPYNDMSG